MDAAPVPRHLVLVALLGLSGAAFCAFDFVMTNIRDTAYIARIPAEAIQRLDVMPPWSVAAWALGIGGALGGSLLLLVRSRFAVRVFALSVAGTALHGLETGIGGPGLVPGGGAAILLAYSAWMRRRGILR